MNVRSNWGRPLLGVVGVGVAVVLLVTLSAALADSLAIAEQPGTSIGVPAVSVQPTGTPTDAPAVSVQPTRTSTGAATPAPTPSAGPTGIDPTSPSATPEVVPAQDPVVVDDHGGDNPGHDDDIGMDDSGESSGSGSSSG